MEKRFLALNSWLRRLAFLAALLCLGFLAEYLFYRASSSVNTGGPKAEGTQKIVVIGGSVSHALDFGHLEKALRLKLPENTYSVEFLSYPFFSVHNLPSAYAFANSLHPSIILLQIGCDDIQPITGDSFFKADIPAWLFLRSNRKRPLPPELANLNQELSAILKSSVETNDTRALWQFVPFLKKHIEHHAPISELKPLEKALFESALKFRLGEGARDSESAMAILQIGNILRGRPKEKEDESGSVFRQKVEWVRRSWHQIEKSGCEPFLRHDAPDAYDRLGLCWVWKRHPRSSLMEAVDKEGWLMQSVFGGLKTRVFPESEDPLTRFAASSLRGSPRPDPEPKEQEINPVSLKLLEMKVAEVATTARERKQRLFLLHYPNTSYAFVDHLAGTAKIPAIAAADLFPESLNPRNRRTYFIDDLPCGNGHLTDFGSEFWAKRVAAALAAAENN